MNSDLSTVTEQENKIASDYINYIAYTDEMEFDFNAPVIQAFKKLLEKYSYYYSDTDPRLRERRMPIKHSGMTDEQFQKYENDIALMN